MKMDDFFNQGLRYSFELKNDKATKAFSSYLKENPQSSPAFLNRGNCYFQEGFYDKAVEDYDNALLLNPNNAEIYKIRAWVLYFKDWANTHGNHLSVLGIINHAIKVASEQNLKEAFLDFEKALQISNDNAFAFYQRGLLYAQIGDHIKAIKDLTESMRLAPNIVGVYYDRGNLYQQQSLYDRAIDDYTLAIGLYPQFTEAMYNRGIAFLQKGNYESATVDLNAVLEIKPDDSDAKNTLQKLNHLKR